MEPLKEIREQSESQPERNRRVMLEVKHVSKSFNLRDKQVNSFKGTVAQFFTSGHHVSQRLPALKDISFELMEGEALGIIGANGAGKSTLLRILSGVSQPDDGEINFYGQAVSILDIGAGFHPELTGRENIYLTATLYRFTRRKINERLEEIIEFSGIREFIDQPVKNYSAGMYLRLAFSIITCLDADIYIIDEVINVGDANFQSKCKIKVDELIAAGKTLLIASHNLNEISVLCNRVILMEHGAIVETGGADIIQKYMTRTLPQFFALLEKDFYHLQDMSLSLSGLKDFKFIACRLLDYKRGLSGISCESAFKICFDFELPAPARFLIKLKVYDSTGVLVFFCNSSAEVDGMSKAGKYALIFEMPANLFNERIYYMDFELIDDGKQSVIARQDKFLVLKIADDNRDKRGATLQQGVVKPNIRTILC